MKKHILYFILFTTLLFIASTPLWSQSETIDGWYEKGKNEMQKEQYKAAIKSFSKAQELCIQAGKSDGNCKHIDFNIGVCAFEIKSYPQAVRAFTKNIEKNPNDHEAYNYRAAAYSAMGERQKALSDCNKAEQIARPIWDELGTETQAWYLSNLAIACRDVNQLEAAIFNLQRALDIHYDAQDHLELIKIKLQLGRIKEVKEDLRNPKVPLDNNIELNLIIGRIKMLEGHYDQAINYFEDVTEDRDIDAAHRHLVYCYIQLNYMDAARKYLKFLAQNNYNETERAYLESKLATREGRWEEAIDWADNAESLHSEFDTLIPHIRLQRARVHYHQGNYVDAIGECRLITQKTPRHPYANSLQGLAYLEMGEIQKAQLILQQCSIDHPNNPIVLARWHWLRFRTGDKDAAMQELLYLVSENPQLAEIRYYYAECCHNSGKYNSHECESNVDMALGWYPSLGDAHALKARMLMDKGNAETASMYIQRAEELGVVHSFGASHLVYLYIKNQTPQKALALSESVLQRKQDIYAKKWHALALVTNGRNKEAIDWLTPLIDKYPQHWELYKIRGMAEAHLGKYRQALNNWDRAVGLNSYDAELFRLRGRAYAVFGEWDMALLELNEAISLQPEYVKAHYDMGRTYLDQGKYSEAAQALEQALTHAHKHHPQIGMIYNDLGLAKVEMNDLPKAMEYYTQGIELAPSELLYENRAKLHLQLNNLTNAIADFQRAIAINGDNPEQYYRLGKAQKSIYRHLEAAQSFTFAITIRLNARMKVPADYYQQRGECFLALGGEYLTHAEGDFIHTRENDPHNWQPFYYLGKCKYEKGEFRRALEYFSDAIILNSERTELYVARGDAYSQIEQFSQAAKDYGSAIQLNPNDICYQKKKGHAHLRDNNWWAAIQQYENALDWAEKNGYDVEIELYHGLARSYSGKAHDEDRDVTYELAIAYYQKALNQSNITEQEKYYVLLNMMTTYEKWGKPDDAERIRAQLHGVGKYEEPNVVGCTS